MGIFDGYDPTVGSADDNVATESSADTTVALDPVTAVTQQRLASADGYAMMQGAQLSTKLALQNEDVRHALRDMQMVSNFAAVADEYNLSAPVVAAFRAAPGFDQAVQNFPTTDKFNIVPEHRTAVNNEAGLESFTQATGSTASAVQTVTLALATTFGDILANTAVTVPNLLAQVERDIISLEASEMTDELLALKSVTTVPVLQLNETLAKLELYLNNVSPFEYATLQANPEKIVEEIQGLESVKNDVGGMLGLTLDEYGFRDGARDAAYIPTASTFGQMGMSVNDVNLLLNRSKAVLEALGSVAERKDSLVASLSDAVSAMPQTLESNDVTYGARDHVTLTSCYTSFVAKLVTESVQAAAMALSVADTALDTHSGSF